MRSHYEGQSIMIDADDCKYKFHGRMINYDSCVHDSYSMNRTMKFTIKNCSKRSISFKKGKKWTFLRIKCQQVEHF